MRSARAHGPMTVCHHFPSCSQNFEHAALEIVLASGSGGIKSMHDVHTRDLLSVRTSPFRPCYLTHSAPSSPLSFERAPATATSYARFFLTISSSLSVPSSRSSPSWIDGGQKSAPFSRVWVCVGVCLCTYAWPLATIIAMHNDERRSTWLQQGTMTVDPLHYFYACCKPVLAR